MILSLGRNSVICKQTANKTWSLFRSDCCSLVMLLRMSSIYTLLSKPALVYLFCSNRGQADKVTLSPRSPAPHHPSPRGVFAWLSSAESSTLGGSKAEHINEIRHPIFQLFVAYLPSITHCGLLPSSLKMHLASMTPVEVMISAQLFNLFTLNH